MGLSTKFALVIAALFALFGLSDYLIERRVLLPSFEELEEDAARTDMKRVVGTAERELEQFEAFCGDWGNWADTYAYVVDRDPAFIADNLNDFTLQSAGVDFMAIVDLQGRYVWKTGYYPSQHKPRQYVALEGDALPAEHPFRGAIAHATSAHGLISTELGPAYLVVAPILDGAGNGPSRGSIILGRIVTDDVVARIAKQAQVSLHLGIPSAVPPAGPAGREPSPVVEPKAEITTVTQVLRGLDGRPVLEFRVDVPRRITARGAAALKFARFSLVISAIGVLAVLFVVLRSLVVRPLAQIQAFTARVAEQDDLSQRLSVTRRDEIGELARALNVMVERLAHARRAVVDHSFEAGLAEMARGVLHNIGNALTPILVNAGALQGRLAKLPSADLVRASDELETADTARQAKLRQFLRLTSTEVQRRVGECRETLGTVTDGILAIQGILHQQSRFSRTALQVEAVELAELVESARRLVPPDVLTALDVVIDSTVAAVGAVPLPRIALQQVLQNIVLNACEAAVPGRHGRLVITAECIDTGVSSHLQITLADDGSGIAAEDLPRLMTKGFSTKSGDGNSGLGLHWCANALRGLGGELRVDSAGPGHGATFTIQLPLSTAPGATNTMQGALAA